MLTKFLAAWMTLAGDVPAILAELKLAPTEFFALLADPETQKHLDAYDDLVARRARMLAAKHQALAAQALADSLAKSVNPAERLRAAIALARTAHQMNAIVTPKAPAAARLARSTSSAPAPDRTPPSATPNTVVTPAATLPPLRTSDTTNPVAAIAGSRTPRSRTA